jgi:hypothetical protein
MRNFIRDIRFALRTLAKYPGFAVIGIVTLALGMAVNTRSCCTTRFRPNKINNLARLCNTLYRFQRH